MTLHTEAGALDAVASEHRNAAAAIDSCADSVADCIDGGLATNALLAILSTVLGTAGDLVDINRAAAAQVVAVRDELGAQHYSVSSRTQALAWLRRFIISMRWAFSRSAAL